MLISIIGAGGKTTFMLRIAQAAADRSVLMTTTTHIFPVSPPECRTLLMDPLSERLLDELEHPGIVCAGCSCGNGKLSALSSVLFAQAVQKAELTLCEADGAHHLPLKLHRSEEPVMLEHTDLCLIVAGLSALGQPVGTVVHRYECNPLWKAQPERAVGTEEVLFCIEETVRASKMPYDKIRIALNQADTPQLRAQVRPIQNALTARGLNCRVGSLHHDAWSFAEWVLEGTEFAVLAKESGRR